MQFKYINLKLRPNFGVHAFLHDLFLLNKKEKFPLLTQGIVKHVYANEKTTYHNGYILAGQGHRVKPDKQVCMTAILNPQVSERKKKRWESETRLCLWRRRRWDSPESLQKSLSVQTGV